MPGLTMRSEEDPQVQDQAAVLDVVQVVFELLRRSFDGSALAVVDLGPAGDARLDHEPCAIEGDPFFQLGDPLRTLRTRADDAHLAEDDVHELRDFIQVHATKEAAYAGRTWILLQRPLRFTCGLH